MRHGVTAVLAVAAMFIVLPGMLSCDQQTTGGMSASSEDFALPPPCDVDIHYYITADSGVAELWCVPDSVPVVPATWTEVTLAVLDSLEITAPSVAEEQAIQQGDAEVIETDGYEYVSWLTPQIIHGMDHVVAGARSARPWYSPGWNRVACSFYVKWSLYDSQISNWNRLWRSYVTSRPYITDVSNYWHYKSKGLHGFNHVNWQYSSYAETNF